MSEKESILEVDLKYLRVSVDEIKAELQSLSKGINGNGSMGIKTRVQIMWYTFGAVGGIAGMIGGTLISKHLFG